MLFKASKKDIHIIEIIINYYQVPKSNLVRENPMGVRPHIKRMGAACHTFYG